MGMVYEAITLRNAFDMGEFSRGRITEKDIREVSVTALVDTGTGTLVINEEICQRLGLRIVGLRGATLANNKKEVCKVTEAVWIGWKNRDTECRALVVPGDSQVLLGAIPLEDMDLMVDPVHHRLAGVHGDEVIAMLM